MKGPVLTWWRAAAVALAVQRAAAQTCYYPNGSEAPSTEKPCSSAEGSACCPDNWQCLDNGLCYYPATKLYGRYSCTDKDWNSPGCPSNMCTYDMTASGGESITQCSDHDNDWCCNADAQHVNCCKESPSPRPFFQLQDGKAYATVGSSTASSVPTISSITGLATGTGTAGSASQTSAGASSGGSSAGSRAVTADATSASASPYTSLSASVTSDAGGVRTVYNTLIITPTSDPTAAAGSSSTGSKSKSNLGLIIGCAVGIPLVLAFLGIAIWLLRKRRQQKANANPYKETSEIDDNSPNSPGFIGGAAGKLGKKQTFRSSRPGTAEIDGNPVGPGRPVSTVKGHAELESGSGFRPGQNAPYAPDTVGLGGGNGADRSTWGSIPPQYSPAYNQTGFTHNHNPEATELDSTTVMPVINEKAESEPQYIAYRPPQSQQPPPAELPTVKTPPEDLEKQIHHK